MTRTHRSPVLVLVLCFASHWRRGNLCLKSDGVTLMYDLGLDNGMTPILPNLDYEWSYCLFFCHNYAFILTKYMCNKGFVI